MSNASATHQIVAPKKLIEVAIPLDEINRWSVKEKSIKQGHPSTLHLWWARRPLAAARAVLFAQLVNDPSWKYSEEELRKPQIRSAITRKRNELFRLINELVKWENTTNEELLAKARAAILESWRETCEANLSHPQADTLFNPDTLPRLHDPFAGGGSIPLEAQRLGLDAIGTDLNPVAVLINKATLELPARFAGNPPVGPVPSGEKQTKAKFTENWSGARGLAEDIRRYGAWMREEAQKLLGQLFPPKKLTPALCKDRRDLQAFEGREQPVVAYIWARTVASSNPAANGIHVPLVTTWFLSKKEGAEVWIEPVIGRNSYRLQIKSRVSGQSPPSDTDDGTKQGRGANFKCLLTGTSLSPDYIKSEGLGGRLGKRMLAVVVEGNSGRLYVEATQEDESIAINAKSTGAPAEELNNDPRAIWCPLYGLRRYCDLFTERQLAVMTTYASLVSEVQKRATTDAVAFGKDAAPIANGGKGARAYGELIAVYMSFLVAAASDDLTSLGARWSNRPKTDRHFCAGVI